MICKDQIHRQFWLAIFRTREYLLAGNLIPLKAYTLLFLEVDNIYIGNITPALTTKVVDSSKLYKIPPTVISMILAKLKTCQIEARLYNS